VGVDGICDPYHITAGKDMDWSLINDPTGPGRGSATPGSILTY